MTKKMDEKLFFGEMADSEGLIQYPLLDGGGVAGEGADDSVTRALERSGVLAILCNDEAWLGS